MNTSHTEYFLVPNSLTRVKLSTVLFSYFVFPYSMCKPAQTKMMNLFSLQIMYSRSVTQENGPVHPLACVSPWISCAMGRLTVPRERMKLTPLLDAIAVSTNTTSVMYTYHRYCATEIYSFTNLVSVLVRYLEMCLSEL